MFTMRTVHELYTDPDGSPAEGFVLFWPSTVMINGGVTAPSRVRADLDMTGDMTVLLCANDDAGTAPTGDGVFYWVEEHIKGAPNRRYAVKIPAAGSGPITLSSLVSVENPPPLTFPVAGPQGPEGPTGPQGPPGPPGTGVSDHGALTGLSDDDHSQYYNQTRGDARYVQSTALNELVDDRVAALLVAGNNVTLTYNDAADTLTVGATGGGGSAIENTHSITGGSAATLDPAVTGTYKIVTLTAASCTLTLGAGVAGQTVRMDVDLVMDATGGRAVVWPNSPTLKWVNGSGPPTLVSTANAINSFHLWNPNNLGWRAAVVGLGIS